MTSIIENYGVKLIPLCEDSLEMVRIWRNDLKISQYMEYRDYITPEMQKKWFSNLNKDTNFYYIINYNNEDIGLINIKDYDSIKKDGEAGIFIYEDKYLNTDIAYRAHLVLFDCFFDKINLNKIKSHILDSNARAIRFAKFLGSKKIDDENYILAKENYFNNKNRLHFVKKWNCLTNKSK